MPSVHVVPALPAPGPALFHYTCIALSLAHPRTVSLVYRGLEPSGCIPAPFHFAYVALSPAYPRTVSPVYRAQEPSGCILGCLYLALHAQPLLRSVYVPMTT